MTRPLCNECYEVIPLHERGPENTCEGCRDDSGWILRIACPFSNCGAEEGEMCVVEHNDDREPTIRHTPHARRVKMARMKGHEPPKQKENQ